MLPQTCDTCLHAEWTLPAPLEVPLWCGVAGRKVLRRAYGCWFYERNEDVLEVEVFRGGKIWRVRKGDGTR
jgi:hypothetical protein